MSDRPANPTPPIPTKPRHAGGWRKPAASGSTPSAPATNATEPVSVPALPKDRTPTPRAEGQWHLPKPNDTIYTTQDMTQISPERLDIIASRPEDILLTLGLGTNEAPPAPVPMTESTQTAATPPTETTPAPAAEAEPLKPGAEEETETENAPTSASATDSANLLDLERTATEITGKPETVSDDEDENAFSMSELIALSSLVEQNPQTDIKPNTPATATTGQTVDVSPTTERGSQGTGRQAATEATEDLSQTGAEDPAEYARRQLESLGVTETGTGAAAASPAAATPTQTTEDPAAYARRQLEQLGIGAGQPATSAPAASVSAPAAATGLTPQQQDLARKFQDTETQVRALRAQYQAGQITRDQLQDQLKRLMILDENQTWWMMGVESDNWYRFENNSWVLAQPPYLNAGVSPVRTVSDITGASQAMQGSLPYFPSQQVQPVGDQTQPTFGTPVPTGDTGGYGITEELGLPRTDVPIEDPERTVVGSAGAYVQPVQEWAQPTVQGINAVSSPTVVNPAVSVGQGVGIPAAVDPYATAPEYSAEAAAATPTYEEIAARQRRQNMRTGIAIVAVVIGLMVLLVAGSILFIVSQYNGVAGQYKPQIDALANYQPEFQTARILDVNGNQIAELNSQAGGSRTTVTLDKISPFMIHAVVSLENPSYYTDPGWDYGTIGNAFLQNLGVGGTEVATNTTLTQQIAEQLILKQSANTPQLKWDETVIASQIAQNPTYDKNFILQLYLNEVYFGNQAYGVEAASQFYFGHSANDLNLPEAAMLAGMIANPSQFNPVRSGDDTQDSYNARRDQTFKRMDQVIQTMQQVGCLQFQNAPYLDKPFCIDASVVKQATVQKAQVEAANYQPRTVTSKYPHFVQYVQALVEHDFGSGQMFRQGFVIKTTLNPAVQDLAQAALTQTMQSLIVTGVNTGSVMVTDPRNGAIRAMVGSPDFNNNAIQGQVNGALTWQQPGGAIYPIVYTGALEGVDTNGDGRPEYMTPATVLWDVPTTFQGNFTPVDLDGAFRGPIAVRYALQNSYNVPAVKAYEFIGDAKFQDIASRMGLSFLQTAQFGPQTGNGGTEVTLYDMMSAYGTLANAGTRVPLYAIESITDSAGNPIALPARAQPVQAVQPQIAYLTDSILSDDAARATAFGANGPLTIKGLPTSNVVAAKTGSSDGARDLWTIGFTQNAVVGVWLGRPDNNTTNVNDGGLGSAAPLWNRVMTAVLQTMPAPTAFPIPQGIIQQQICTDTGTLPASTCTSLRNELFVEAQPPPSADQAFVQQVPVDTWTGLRANSFCPDNQITINVLNITDASAVNWLNSAAGASLAARYGIGSGTQATAPTASCDTNTEVPIARIISPTDGQTISGMVQVTGAASAASFNRYQLEFASAAAPTSFSIISGPTTVPQTSGLLGQWNTTSVANGTYVLRLSMFSNSGGYLYRTITVNVNNVAPTAIPQPTVNFPQPGSTSIGGTGGVIGVTATPIPFDLVATPG